MLESKRRAIIFLTVSLLLAAVAGYLLLKKVTDLGEMEKVYVAAENIPSRTELKPEYIKMVDIPRAYYNDKSHVHKDEIDEMKGMAVIVPLEEGAIITKEILKPRSATFNENNRLLSITRSDRVQIDIKLEENQRVDIIVSHKFDGEPVTETFMKDVLVSKVSDNGIIIEVSAEDAPKIIHMQNYADSMRILLANVAEEEAADEEVKEKKKPEKAPEPPAKEPAQQPAQQPAEKPATDQPAPQATQQPAS